MAELLTRSKITPSKLIDCTYQCVVGAHALLRESLIPGYHRIRSLLILARIMGEMGDFDEALHHHDKAGVVLAVVRSQKGQDATRGAKFDAA